ncbi:MAG TPA: hypothetical protein VG013_06405 [Gemmataceae bacterium]|jgi:hypothetical protein|nr:hypothetical protein [Gemmataceae bacterium]
MKLGEMADLLAGLASALERFLGKGALNDLQVVSECFRRFGDESAKSFCEFVVKAKEGRGPGGRTAGGADAAAVGGLADEVRRFLQNRAAYDVAAIRALAARVGRLTVPNIKAVGAAVGCPLGGKKADMVSRLENWLLNIKLSAEQSSFT